MRIRLGFKLTLDIERATEEASVEVDESPTHGGSDSTIRDEGRYIGFQREADI